MIPRIAPVLSIMAALSLCLMLGCSDDSTSAPGEDSTADAAPDSAADTVATDSANGSDAPPFGEVRQAGSCPQVSCADGNPCTVDQCNMETGECRYSIAPDGSPCGCTDSGVCFAGICTGNEQVCTSDEQCDDGLLCTLDRCIVGCECRRTVVDDCIEPEPGDGGGNP